jgi:hypothetical protein
MDDKELPTLNEVLEKYGKGELKEGSLIVCRLNGQYGGKIWMPYEEIKIQYEWENSEQYKKQEAEIWYGK